METLRVASYSVLIAVGLPANLLTLLVMSRRNLRASSLSLQLRALAVCSSLALLFQLGPALAGAALGVPDPYSTSYFACTGLFFVSFTSGDVAVWIVPCVAADRVAAVFMPTRSRRLCGPRTARLQLLALLVLAAAKNCLLFAMQRLQEVPAGGGGAGGGAGAGNGSSDNATAVGEAEEMRLVCMWREEFVQVKNIRSYIAAILVAILPVAATVGLNGLLLVGMRRRLQRVGAEAAETSAAAASSSTHSEDARAVRASIVVTQAVSAAFLVCLVPNFSYLALQTFRPTSDSVAVEASWLAEALSLMYNVNHVVNFFLYVAASPTFRAELRGLLAGLVKWPAGRG